MLTCNICGHTAKALGWHVKKVHNLKPGEYSGRLAPAPNNNNADKGLTEFNRNKGLANKAKFDEAVKLIEQKFKPARLKELYETGHTPKIIANNFVTPEMGFVHKHVAHALRVILPYENKYFKIHLSKPNWWRDKWKHGLSDEEAKRISHERNTLSMAKIAEKRRNCEYGYTKQYSVEYWLSTGLSQQEAVDAALASKKTRSPRTVEFWMTRGLTLEQAKEKVSDICRLGGFAACQKLDGKFTSSLETKIAMMLDELGIKHTRQHFITDGVEKYMYDFKIGNVILEVNGTYWHADPRVYSPKDMNKTMGMTSAQIWERDAKKRRIAVLKGFKFVTIWEIDIVKLTISELQSIVE